MEGTLAQSRVVVTAVLDRHQSVTRNETLSADSRSFKDAIASLAPDSSARIPSAVTGSRDVLLVMQADAEPAPAAGQQQQQQQQQSVVVQPAPAPAEQTGLVVVTSSVDGSEVIVDGAFAGNAPANLRLAPGIHIVEVKAAGYATFKRELRVTAGGEVPLRAVLERQ